MPDVVGMATIGRRPGNGVRAQQVRLDAGVTGADHGGLLGDVERRSAADADHDGIAGGTHHGGGSVDRCERRLAPRDHMQRDRARSQRGDHPGDVAGGLDALVGDDDHRGSTEAVEHSAEIAESIDSDQRARHTADLIAGSRCHNRNNLY